MSKVNNQSFDTQTPNGREHFQKLLNSLLDYNSDPDEEYYNDIHIYQEESLIIIEWVEVPYSHEWGGNFVHVDDDQVVMLEKYFPDNHCELCYDEDDYEERLKDFLDENPGWEKTSYGTWTNRIENESFKKMLEEQEKDPLREPTSEEIQKIVDDWAKEQGVESRELSIKDEKD